MPYRLFYQRVIRVYCGSPGETRFALDSIAVRALLFLRSSALSRRRPSSVWRTARRCQCVLRRARRFPMFG
jgi:hypothetical protein